MIQRLIQVRLLALFAGMALVLPPTAYLVTLRGWTPGSAGTTIALMTVLAVVSAPFWGAIDDRANGLGLRVSAGLSSALCLGLWACAAFGAFSEAIAIPLLLGFGAASGGIEPLISARIQRLRLMARFPGLRLFGSGGWALGLIVAAAATVANATHFVYLGAAFFFAVLLIDEVARGRLPSKKAVGSWRIEPRIALFVLIGLPVPVSAYLYLIFAAAMSGTFGLESAYFPFATLIVLAVLEIPAFALIQRVVPGRPVIALYLAALGSLAGSWLLFLVAEAHPAMHLLVLLIYTIAGALWISLQVTVVHHFSSPAQAGLAQSSTSAITKSLGALLSGVVLGWLIQAAGMTAAVWFVVLACSLSLVVLCALPFFSIPIRTMRMPRIDAATNER